MTGYLHVLTHVRSNLPLAETKAIDALVEAYLSAEQQTR